MKAKFIIQANIKDEQSNIYEMYETLYEELTSNKILFENPKYVHDVTGSKFILKSEFILIVLKVFENKLLLNTFTKKDFKGNSELLKYLLKILEVANNFNVEIDYEQNLYNA